MSWFLRRSFRKAVVYRLALVVSAVLILVLLQFAFAEGDESLEASEQQQGDLQIGVYNPQQVFNMYQGTQSLRQELQQMQLQGQMDQQQMKQAMQQKQQQLIQTFRNDLEQVVQQSAEEAKVAVVAVQVIYHKPDVEVKDLTNDLVGRINKLAGQRTEQQQGGLTSPAMPGSEEK